MVAPWFRSASGTAPSVSSAMLANGSGSTAASTAPALRAAGIWGNEYVLTKRTAFGAIPCSCRTDAASRCKMLSGALMATVRPFNCARDLIGESGIVYRLCTPGSITEPSAKISGSALPACCA